MNMIVNEGKKIKTKREEKSFTTGTESVCSYFSVRLKVEFTADDAESNSDRKIIQE